MQHIPYEHIERLAKGRHADLITAGREHRHATAASAPKDTRAAAHPRFRTRVRVVAAGAVTAAVFTAGAGYAFVEAPGTPESPEPADSLVVDRFRRPV